MARSSALDSEGKPLLRDLLFRRAEPMFYAFDLLWDEHAKSDDEQEQHRFRDGEDLRYLPLRHTTHRWNLSSGVTGKPLGLVRYSRQLDSVGREDRAEDR